MAVEKDRKNPWEAKPIPPREVPAEFPTAKQLGATMLFSLAVVVLTVIGSFAYVYFSGQW